MARPGLPSARVTRRSRFFSTSRSVIDEHVALGVADDLLARGGRPCGGEDGEPAEHRAFVGTEQVVAPPDRRTQGAVAAGALAGRRVQQKAPVAESDRELLGLEVGEPGRRHLEREGQSLEVDADPGQRRRVRGVAHEAGAYATGLPHQQLHRGHRGETGRIVGGGRPRHLQRRHREGALRGHVQPLPAGGEHAQAGGGPEHLDDDLAQAVDPLAPVQHQQHPGAAQRRGQPLADLVGGATAQIERPVDRQQRLGRAAAAGQVHRPAAGEAVHDHTGQGVCKRRLAHSRWTSEREQPGLRGRERSGQGLELGSAPHQQVGAVGQEAGRSNDRPRHPAIVGRNRPRRVGPGFEPAARQPSERRGSQSGRRGCWRWTP